MGAEGEEGDGRKKDKRGQNAISSMHFIAAFYVKHDSRVAKTSHESDHRNQEKRENTLFSKLQMKTMTSVV